MTRSAVAPLVYEKWRFVAFLYLVFCSLTCANFFLPVSEQPVVLFLKRNEETNRFECPFCKKTWASCSSTRSNFYRYAGKCCEISGKNEYKCWVFFANHFVSNTADSSGNKGSDLEDTALPLSKWRPQNSPLCFLNLLTALTFDWSILPASRLSDGSSCGRNKPCGSLKHEFGDLADSWRKVYQSHRRCRYWKVPIQHKQVFIDLSILSIDILIYVADSLTLNGVHCWMTILHPWWPRVIITVFALNIPHGKKRYGITQFYKYRSKSYVHPTLRTIYPTTIHTKLQEVGYQFLPTTERRLDVSSTTSICLRPIACRCNHCRQKTMRPYLWTPWRSMHVSVRLTSTEKVLWTRKEKPA